MRSSPSIAWTRSSSCTNGRDAAGGRVLAAAVARHDLAQERDLAHAARDQARGIRRRSPPSAASARRPRVFGTMQKEQFMSQPCWMETKALTGAIGRLQVVADRVLGAFLLGRCRRSSRRIGTPGFAGGPEIVEVVGHAVKFLGADDQVHVRQPVEEAPRRGSGPCSPGSRGRSRVACACWARTWPALPMAFCSAASRTLQVFSSRMSQSSSAATIR